MPWEIRHENGHYNVYRADTGKRVARHTTKQKAQAQIRIMSTAERVKGHRDQGATFNQKVRNEEYARAKRGPAVVRRGG